MWPPSAFVMTAPPPPSSLRSEFAGLWRLALPLALAQAGQALMGLVDTAVVGRLSATAQAGAGLGTSLSFTVLFFGMGVMLALDPLVSQAIGAGRPGEARHHLWQGVWLALLTSVPVMAVTAGLAVALPSLGVNSEVAESARRFMWWRLGAAPGVLLFIGVRSYLQGLGRPSVALWGTVLASVLNLGLDLVLVFGAGPLPSLGVAGAALATVASTWAQLGLLVLAVGPSPPGVRRAPRSPRCSARRASACRWASTSSPSRASSLSPASWPGGWARWRAPPIKRPSPGRASPSRWPRASAARRPPGWGGPWAPGSERRPGWPASPRSGA